MMMRFKNKTNQIQQINMINGSGIKISPKSPNGGFADIDTSNMYKDEVERAKKFFIITPVPEVKTSSGRTFKGGFIKNA